MNHDPWQQFVTAFNEQRFVDGVLQLEELWFVGRSDFYKGLIRLSVALNQLRLGLLTSPRMLLRTADELLAPFAPHHHGLDIEQLRRLIAQCRACIPDDLETGAGRVEPDLIPHFALPLI